jgi:membrane associated rhomboid family serine protease
MFFLVSQPMERPSKTVWQELKTHAWVLGSVVAVLWAIQIVNAVIFRGGLAIYGIAPRNLVGLRGILFAPLLHGGFGHLMANTLPLITLGWLIMLQDTADFLWVTLIAMVVSGIGTWLVGATTSIHVGASGVIFGYFGFLLARGYFERSVSAIALALIVFALYGSLIWGVLPSQPGVSWEGHLFGFIGGVVGARLLSQRPSSSS